MTMQTELKPCSCGNTVEVKYIAGIEKSLLQYIYNLFGGSMSAYYINCNKCGRIMMVRQDYDGAAKKINSGAS